MKVVHVSTLYYPFVGGLEVAVQKIAESQAELGHEVHVLTSDQYAEGWRGTRWLNNVIVHRIASLKLHYPFLTIPFGDVEDVLKEADVIHGWGHSYYFVYKVLVRAKNLSKPAVTYFIGVDYLMHHYNPLMRFFGFKYQEFITKRVVEVSDLALVTNEYEGEILKKKYGKESVVLPHGVDDLYFKVPNMARQFKEKYGVEGRIIAYIGRIHPTKGLDLLIKAFAEVSRCEPDLVLLVAGKGDTKYIKRCMSLAEKLGVKGRVRHLGYLSEEDKIGLIDASEFVVIPSRHSGECYSIVVDEVKGRGKPLVVTNYGALPNRIVNYIEGVVVNANANSLARGIEYALSNIKSFRVLSKPYTWSEVNKKLLTLYEEVKTKK